MQWRMIAEQLQMQLNDLHKAEHSQDLKEDTYDDALAYIVQSHDMHKEKSEEVDTDELLGMETKPGTKW